MSDNPLDWSLDELIEKANARILSRVVYGMYMVTARAPSSVIVWSNANEEWWINQLIGRLKKGESREIDANQILVPGRLRDIKQILPHLEPLPLHSSGPRGGSREVSEWRIPEEQEKLDINNLERWSRGEFLDDEFPDE